jgi:hypothetical protein
MPDDERQQARQEIAAAYARLCAAFAHKDLGQIGCIHDPAYRQLQVTGEEWNAQEAMASLEGDLAPMEGPILEVAIDAIALHGEKADVVARSTLSFLTSLSSPRAE